MIGLKHGKGSDESSEGKQHGQWIKGFRQRFTNHIHRSALELSQIISSAVHNTKGAGEKFCGNADDCRNPHPKYSPGTARNDGECNPSHVPQTHSIGEGGSQRLHMGEFSGLVRRIVLAKHDRKGMAEVAVGQRAGGDQKKDTAAKQ